MAPKTQSALKKTPTVALVIFSLLTAPFAQSQEASAENDPKTETPSITFKLDGKDLKLPNLEAPLFEEVEVEIGFNPDENSSEGSDFIEAQIQREKENLSHQSGSPPLFFVETNQDPGQITPSMKEAESVFEPIKTRLFEVLENKVSGAKKFWEEFTTNEFAFSKTYVIVRGINNGAITTVALLSGYPWFFALYRGFQQCITSALFNTYPDFFMAFLQLPKEHFLLWVNENFRSDGLWSAPSDFYKETLEASGYRFNPRESEVIRWIKVNWIKPTLEKNWGTPDSPEYQEALDLITNPQRARELNQIKIGKIPYYARWGSIELYFYLALLVDKFTFHHAPSGFSIEALSRLFPKILEFNSLLHVMGGLESVALGMGFQGYADSKISDYANFLAERIEHKTHLRDLGLISYTDRDQERDQIRSRHAQSLGLLISSIGAVSGITLLIANLALPATTILGAHLIGFHSFGRWVEKQKKDLTEKQSSLQSFKCLQFLSPSFS